MIAVTMPRTRAIPKSASQKARIACQGVDIVFAIRMMTIIQPALLRILNVSRVTFSLISLFSMCIYFLYKLRYDLIGILGLFSRKHKSVCIGRWQRITMCT